MSSEDYLVRYFQQLGKVLAAVLGFREKKKYQQAIAAINQVLTTWFDLNDSELEAMSPSQLEQFLLTGRADDLDRLKAVAELLYQKIITYKQMELTNVPLGIAKKSLHLFKVFDRQSGAFSIDVQERIAELDEFVSGAASD